MKTIDIHYPHKFISLFAGIMFVLSLLVNVLLAYTWCHAVIAAGTAAAVASIIFLLLMLGKLIEAAPTYGWQNSQTAVILGFGYEKDGEGEIKAGKANTELLRWVIESVDYRKSKIRNILVQEGIWAAVPVLVDEGILKSSRIRGGILYIKTGRNNSIRMARIHKHNENVYVNTYNTLYLAAERINRSKKKNILLVAHDLQLQRSVFTWNVAVRMHRNIFTNLELAVPHLERRFSGSFRSISFRK
jgi:hypothetical protein